MRRLMISMPMNGKTDKEIEDEWAQWREAFIEYNLTHSNIEPFVVVNTLFETPIKDYKYINLYYLAKSIEAMAKEIDVVFFAPGWEKHRGCQIEHHICEEYGIGIITYEMLCNPLVNFPIPGKYKQDVNNRKTNEILI